MGLGDRIEDLTGLLIALSIYLILRWAQRRWPDPPGKRSPRKKNCECDACQEKGEHKPKHVPEDDLPSEDDLIGDEG